MITLPPRLRVVVIGGTSHAGKSTVAERLASGLGWDYLSTDRLAKHPGRPWRHDGVAVPSHVAHHYATLPVEELLVAVLEHYARNVLPQIESLVQARVADSTAKGLILEGSAIWPEFVERLRADQVAALWLTAHDNLLVDRIHAECRYLQRGAHEQFLIDKFVQ